MRCWITASRSTCGRTNGSPSRRETADEPIPNAIYESITMVVRARGSDLADFRAGRLTREEMLKRVEVRGF